MEEWAKGFTACKLCNTTRNPHHGQGLCRVCHALIWRKRNPEKVSEQADKSYIKNYVLRNEVILARRRERYLLNKEHRANAQENARRQYRKNPEAYKKRAEERRIRIDRDAFEKVKPSILKRDNYTCQKCFRTREDGMVLHVHHKDLNGANHNQENLITLCGFCHKGISQHHAHQRKYS
jgi:hypothetical protein